MKMYIKQALITGISVMLAACDSNDSSEPVLDPGPDTTVSAMTLDQVLLAGARDDAVALDVVALQSDLDGIVAGGRNAEPVALEEGDTVASVLTRLRR